MGRRKANQETVPEYTSFPCYTDRRAKTTKKVKKATGKVAKTTKGD